jgi:signal transduction histidine kinase
MEPDTLSQSLSIKKVNMKLQFKINIRFLLLSLIVFFAGGVIFYFVLIETIDNEVDHKLRDRKEKIQRNIRQQSLVDSIIESPDQSILLKKINHKNHKNKLSDTLVYDKFEKEYIPSRSLTFTATTKDAMYEVIIIQSLIESDELVEAIFYFLVGLFVSIIALLFFLNRWMSASIWKPFYATLDMLNIFEVGKTPNLKVNTSNIHEFNQLDSVLERMIKKINTDFINLKEFSENASHEIQTPLAIIKSKLELVLQDKNLSGEQHRQIHAAFESAIRLSKLNEALLLLSKIENKQFIDKKDIDLTELLKTRLEYMEELLAMKQLEIISQFVDPFVIPINPVLAEILINNLLSNAWKHGFTNGKIMITSQDRKITVSNTGEPINIEPSKLFNRFTKHKPDSESMGLGLAIAKEICNNFNLTLHYEYSNGFHSFILSSNI